MKPLKTIFLLLGSGIALSALLATPALAYWQFIERPPGMERKPSARFNTEKECIAVLKVAEERLKKAYPDRYPLVGSCEEFH